MSPYDLIIQRGTLVLPGGPQDGDLAVADGQIDASAPEIAGTSGEAIDATGMISPPLPAA